MFRIVKLDQTRFIGFGGNQRQGLRGQPIGEQLDTMEVALLRPFRAGDDVRFLVRVRKLWDLPHHPIVCFPAHDHGVHAFRELEITIIFSFLLNAVQKAHVAIWSSDVPVQTGC